MLSTWHKSADIKLDVRWLSKVGECEEIHICHTETKILSFIFYSKENKRENKDVLWVQVRQELKLNLFETYIYIYIYIYMNGCESWSVVSDSLWSHGLYSPWNSPGQNTGVGSLSLLQGSSQPRNWTGVSCIAGQILYQLIYQGSYIYICILGILTNKGALCLLS